MTTHEIEIIETVTDGGMYDGRIQYHARCTCGFESEWEWYRGDAESLGAKHVLASDV